MRRLYLMLLGWLCCGGLMLAARADTFTLKDGTTITGEIGSSSCNRDGLLLKQPNGAYGRQRVPWSKLSQESLKKLSEYKDAARWIEPLIEVVVVPEEVVKERVKAKAIDIKPVDRLERPKPPSRFAAIFYTPVGVVMFLLIYAANVYAGYEVAVFKNRPAALVCGVAAAAPLLGLIVFLSLPPVPVKSQEELDAEAAAALAAEGGEQVALEELPSEEVPASTEETPAAPVLPPTISYVRGQFTFNRRFFETKMPGFFRTVPSQEEKDLCIIIRSHRGDYTGQRFSRITPNEIFLQVYKGEASEEIMIPFNDIREVHLKHKDAP